MNDRAAISLVIGVIAGVVLSRQALADSDAIMVWLAFVVGTAVILNHDARTPAWRLFAASFSGPTGLIGVFIYRVVVNNVGVLSGVQISGHGVKVLIFGLLALWLISGTFVFFVSFGSKLLVKYIKTIGGMSDAQANRWVTRITWVGLVIVGFVQLSNLFTKGETSPFVRKTDAPVGEKIK